MYGDVPLVEGIFVMSKRVDFQKINQLALTHIDTLLMRWLPDGKRIGGEWVARNPQRVDRRAGSFKVNLRSGRWGDFATGDYGGDLVSLGAYLHTAGNQRIAAIEMATMLGVQAYE